jgi:ATP-dependent DNA helicase RecG
MSLAASVPFDDRINQRARVGDLSRDLIRSFLRETRSGLAAHVDTLSTEDLGQQLHVLSGSAEAMFPVNVGLLFFNPEPHNFFPITQIDVVWFPEGPGGDKFTEKIFYGPLHLMGREALNYIRRNYIDETVIKHPDRAEAMRVKNFPYAAIEECVINALYHRSYEQREPVEVRVSPDELIVLSYPGPDRSVRLAQLRAGRAVPRRYRNRRIGEFLKELELAEGRSTGVPKIFRAMSQNGSPPPEFEFDEDHSYFMVRLPVHPEARAVSAAVAKSIGDLGTESALSRHQVGILRKCMDDTAIGDLMSIAGRADRTKFRNQILRPLLRAELLMMTIPEKPNSRLQKYQLTKKGRAWLAVRESDAE